jgi:sucrose-6-phosphate hydrolase SacC (GH32 family)
MHWADASRGRPFAKDPSVIRFKDRYRMYFSVPPFGDKRANDGWTIGIAESGDLTHWTKVGELLPAQDCDRRGLCAPGAWIHRGRVHLFYQTYGNGPKDAICHAWSDDGITFTRDATNPIFSPHGAWTAGRAIDAEVFPVGDRLFLYFATRDPAMKVQMVGVAGAPLTSDFSRSHWRQLVDAPILQPELPWEKRCIEAPTLLRREGRLWMFYAGGYNNEPQQIGVAWSTDGLQWTRLSDSPLLPHGAPGSWNASESGHPGVFVDADGRTHLFFQGNNDRGKTWYLSRVEIVWRDGRPALR